MERTHISGCLLSKQRLALAPKAKGKITYHTKPHKAVHTAPDRLWHVPYRNAYLPGSASARTQSWALLPRLAAKNKMLRQQGMVQRSLTSPMGLE